MKKNILIYAVVMSSFCVFSQETDTTIASKDWEFVDFEKGFTGEIIEYYPAPFACGTKGAGSLAIVKKEDGKFIRIITPCNQSTGFKKGDDLIFSPQKKPAYSVQTAAGTEKNKTIKTATYGSITKIPDE